MDSKRWLACFLATVLEMAVSNPADVNEMQRANTGKVSWYRPTFSSPNVWLKKIR